MLFACWIEYNPTIVHLIRRREKRVIASRGKVAFIFILKKPSTTSEERMSGTSLGTTRLRNFCLWLPALMAFLLLEPHAKATTPNPVVPTCPPSKKIICPASQILQRKAYRYQGILCWRYICVRKAPTVIVCPSIARKSCPVGQIAQKKSYLYFEVRWLLLL